MERNKHSLGLFDQAVRLMAKEVWGIKEMRPFQEDAVRVLASSKPGRKLLLVVKTGEGKSIVPFAAGTMLSDIVIVVIPLVSLGADQTLRSQLPVAHNVLSFHLDEEDKKSGGSGLRTWLKEHKQDTKTVFLFTSPQMRENESWQLAIDDIFERQLISLVAVDEVHAVPLWGRYFRKEFSRLPVHICLIKWPSRNAPSHLLQ